MKVVGAHKAGAVLHTHCHGREGHSSAPEKGANAVMMAGEFVRLLDDVWDELRADADPRFDPPHSTVQANMIEGGTAVNILARDALVTWEYRALPDRDAAGDRRARSCAAPNAKSCRNTAPRAGSAAGDRAACELSGPGDGRDIRPRCAWRGKLTGANQAEAVSYGTEAGHFQQCRHSGGDLRPRLDRPGAQGGRVRGAVRTGRVRSLSRKGDRQGIRVRGPT